GQSDATQTVVVRRPFDTRVVTHGTGGDRIREASFGRAATSTGEQTTVLAAAPEAADEFVAVVIGDAEREGRLQRRERRRVAGTECDVYRSMGSPTADHWVPVDDHAD